MTPSISQLEKNSVVEHPKVGENGQGGLLGVWSMFRGPLLPGWGSRARERALRQLWHHDYNTLFRGAIAGLVKRIQSTPWEVIAPTNIEYWQELLMSAEYGDWDRFISKLVVDYSRQDAGSFIELIGPGEADGPIVGPVMGIGMLDSVRCHPTGDPEFPVIYYDRKGRLHIMHSSRVVQFVDSPDSDESVPGYGDSALSRAVAPVWRQILMGRYVEQFLDDKPPPGLMILGNLSKEQFEKAVGEMREKERLDIPSEWAKTVILQSLDTSEKPTAEIISFSKPPEKFDFERYTLIDAHMIALAAGLDIQDIWELAATGIGTGTQSEVLDQKSRGKAIGRILKGLERIINKALPEEVEFKWKYADPGEDQERATVGQIVATTLQIAGSNLTPDEVRQVLANEVESIGDVLRAPDGTVTALADADPKAPGQTPTLDPVNPALLAGPDEETGGDTALVFNATRAVQPVGAIAAALIDGEQAHIANLETALKNFLSTGYEFYDGFVSMASKLIRGEADGRSVRPALRRRLYDSGVAEFIDGLATTGVRATPDDLEVDEWNTINDWFITESTYLSNFLDDLYASRVNEDQLRVRAGLWVNKSLRRIFWEGALSGNRNALYEWQLGSSEEHCRSCLVLNAQKHRMKDWMRNRIYPGSDRLICNGFQCDCRFVRSDGRAQGRLRNVPLEG